MASGIKVSGVWKDIDSSSVRVSGTWRTVNSIHAKVSGVWKEVWPPEPTVDASLTTRTVAAVVLSPATATCYYRLDDNGDVYGGATTSNQLETWRVVGSNPDFDVLFEMVSGTTPAGTNITYGQWMIGMAVDRTMALGQNGIGTNQAVVDVSIRDAATLTVLTTARITMNATVNDNPG